MKNKRIKNEILNNAMPVMFNWIDELKMTTDMTNNQIIFAALSRTASEYSDPQLNYNLKWKRVKLKPIALFIKIGIAVHGIKKLIKRV